MRSGYQSYTTFDIFVFLPLLSLRLYPHDAYMLMTYFLCTRCQQYYIQFENYAILLTLTRCSSLTEFNAINAYYNV